VVGVRCRVVRVVDDDVEEPPGVDDVGEGPELRLGAGEFPGQAGRSEGGLGVRGRHEGFPGGFQFRGGGAEERRACRAVGEGTAYPAWAARTAAFTSAVVASRMACSRCSPVRGSVLRTGAAGMSPLLLFDISNVVRKCERRTTISVPIDLVNGHPGLDADSESPLRSPKF